jgi:signal transduction histidine kinase
MPRLFQAFSQVDHSVAGTGLGLAITRELSHLLGGETWCESQYGKGSTFHIMIICEEDRAGSQLQKTANVVRKQCGAVVCRDGLAADALRRK